MNDGTGVSSYARREWCRCLMRRKGVNSVHAQNTKGPQLAKALSIPHVTAIGIGTTIGAGVYILIGSVARELTGPALSISFLLAGIAAGLSAFCYAELASRCPSAGSAYHYSYVCVGEGTAWLIGWALILEYTIGGSTIARGLSPNLALLFGSENTLPAFLTRQYIPGLDIMVDPCAAILILIVTCLLCIGIKESALAQTIVTSANVCALVFVIAAGGYLGFKTGWPGYELPTGYFPLGIDGVLAGSATVFFAFIGFDAVASTAEEVKNPQRDLPFGIAFALAICCALYMMVSVVLVGIVPYYRLDPDTPISSAFASHGMQWAMYIITIGAITALCASLLGSFLPQPRVYLAMARDGLLPSFFSDVNKHTKVPVKSTIVTGIVAAILAFFMDVSQLAGMVSFGTLLAYTMVAICVLILRYVPPDEVPLQSPHQDSAAAVAFEHSGSVVDIDGKAPKIYAGTSKDVGQHSMGINEEPSDPLILKHYAQDPLHNAKRRKIAGWTIMLTCLDVLLLTFAASNGTLPSIPRFTVCAVGSAFLLCGLIVLYCIGQDDAGYSFGYKGGFRCPCSPLVPVACILINVYLMVNLGVGTWISVAVWLTIGVLVYAFYGRTHSSLRDATYVPILQVGGIRRS